MLCVLVKLRLPHGLDQGLLGIRERGIGVLAEPGERDGVRVPGRVRLLVEVGQLTVAVGHLGADAGRSRSCRAVVASAWAASASCPAAAAAARSSSDSAVSRARRSSSRRLTASVAASVIRVSSDMFVLGAGV